MTSVWDICEMRREMQRQMRLDRVVEVKSQLDYLVAQLSYGDVPQKKKGEAARGRSAEIARLSAQIRAKS